MRVVLVAVIGLSGCYASFAGYVDERDDDVAVADGDAGVEAGADVDGEAGGGDDPDGHADADIDAGDGELVPCARGWYDSTSALCWEDPPLEEWTNWWDAVTYCDGLSLGGYGPGSWRLPTIDELRSLIRGCPATETGGSCGVTEPCLDETCWSTPCGGCPHFSGPGAGGCYWDAALGGPCGWHWSSSFHAGRASNAWGVWSENGFVANPAKTHTGYVRCVRPGP